MNICSFCLREVAQLSLHEARCLKMNYLCGDCGQVVLREEQEDHDREFHGMEEEKDDV
jgi:DNA-directed RNA polymerase subunit RPC12/RpoP